MNRKEGGAQRHLVKKISSIKHSECLTAYTKWEYFF